MLAGGGREDDKEREGNSLSWCGAGTLDVLKYSRPHRTSDSGS